MKEPIVNRKSKKEERDFFSILFDFFRSLKLTIFLLILLALVSIIGTMIAQNAPQEDYIRHYGIGLYEVLDFFGLFDMYHSWWFSAILLLLVINLISCSLERFPRVRKQIFQGAGPNGLEDSMVKTLANVERVRVTNPSGSVLEEKVQALLRKWFKGQQRIETESAITFFSEKGRFSRLGVYIAHLSLLIILIGALVGSIYGFKGFVNIFEGETVNQFYMRSKNADIPRPLPYSVRCDDFKVTFYDLQKEERHVKEYTSILTVLENGKEALRRTVQVNHPLHYKGMAFYQSSYGALNTVTLGVQRKNKNEKTLLEAAEGDTVQVPEMNALIRVLRYAPQVDNLGEGVQVALLGPNQEPRVFWLIKGSAKVEPRMGEEFAITLERVSSKEYTGLQVTKDPGVWIVWLGCGLMIIGFIVSFFFSHQRIWVRIPKGAGEIVIAGSANKNQVGFEKKFEQLVSGVRSRTGERDK